MMKNYPMKTPNTINYLRLQLTILLIIVGNLLTINAIAQKSFTQRSGDVLAFGGPAAVLGSTFIWKDGQKGTCQFIKSMALSQATTISLKYIINKPRPDGDDYAFPSGHTSSAFTAAAFSQKRYGWKIGAPAYALAAYTGWTRIKAKRHDIYDVVAGAAIGVGSGLLFAKPLRNERLNVSLTASGGHYGFVASYSL